jgi:hypothetical protein
MVILSQNKTEIINFDNVQKLNLVESVGSVIIAAHYTDGSVNQIAEYNNKSFGSRVFNGLFNNYRGSAVYELPVDSRT